MQTAHLGLDGLNGLGSDVESREQAVVAVGHGVLYAQTGAGIEIVDGAVEHHRQGAHVGPMSRVAGDVEHLYCLGSVDGEVEAFCLVVDARADGTEGKLVAKHGGYFGYGGASTHMEL